MKIVTAELMRQIDRETIEGVGIPGPELMENAGRGTAWLILDNILPAGTNIKVAIFCGKGNNGGDGYVVARYLHQQHIKVFVYYLGPYEKLSPDARLNFDRAKELDIELHELKSKEDLPENLDVDFIVDAIFGTGFSGAPRGLSADIIRYINIQEKTTIAVDIPSGLNADTGKFEGEVIDADFTFTMGLPKYGLFISPGREQAGYVSVVPIGIPDEVIDKFQIPNELIAFEDVAQRLPVRKPDGHKGDFGKVFILAGSRGLTGAAILAAKSALRAGCGLAKIGCPQTVLPIIAGSVTEATGLPLPDVAKKGALALRGLGEIRLAIQEHDAVIVGPGLGRHHETFELVRRLISSMEKPMIVDADGLNALAKHIDILKNIETPMVLTPHPGEFKRLTSVSVPEDIHQRINVAREFATIYRKVLVLKGSPTIVADKDGVCYVNRTGNSGMATGGSGDVLSGIIGTFLAQKMPPIDAAICGVYIHGYAGDLAANDLTERAMIAGNMVDYLGEVFQILT
ncbi:MAG: NAD(P)H-hydrate dehydratase [FCB group bacterium]|nr:NAD(P)H-hydrate dehydratase [FCB group bacterium]